MVDYREDANTAVVELVIDSKVTTEDFDRIAPRLEAFIKQKGQVKMLEILKNFKGFDLPVLSRGAKFDMQHIKDFSHCAVVSDKGWIGLFARLAGSFIKCEIRTFRSDEIDAARSWLVGA